MNSAAGERHVLGDGDAPLPAEDGTRAALGGNGLERRLVWIFGSPRSGSSWLMSMLAEAHGVAVLDESYIPLHLVPVGHTVAHGEFFSHNSRAEDPNFFFAKRYLPALLPPLRQLILTNLSQQIHELYPSDAPRWVVIKEPNGSHAADSITRLLPNCRVLFLLRDGRDVVDSLADAMLGSNSWWREKREEVAGQPNPSRLAFIRQHARLWVHRTNATERAYESLPQDQRLLVKYEALRTNTPGELRRILTWLQFEESDERIREVSARHAFESISADDRGPGKKARSATPGLWRTHLSSSEQAILDEVMEPTLQRWGYSST